MGEVSATEDFTQATLPILADWQRRNLEILPHAKAMWTRCPGTDQPHDISLTGLVDDVCKRTCFLTIAEAVRGVAQNDANLEKAMTPDGYAQNAKKKQLLVSVAGSGSQHLLREVRAAAPQVKGTMVANSKYLGPHLAFNSSVATELGRRVAAAAAGRAHVGHFWTEEAPLAFKRAVFFCAVINTLCSCVEAFVVLRTQYSALDAAVSKKPRLLEASRVGMKPEEVNAESFRAAVLRRTFSCTASGAWCPCTWS